MGGATRRELLQFVSKRGLVFEVAALLPPPEPRSFDRLISFISLRSQLIYNVAISAQKTWLHRNTQLYRYSIYRYRHTKKSISILHPIYNVQSAAPKSIAFPNQSIAAPQPVRISFTNTNTWVPSRSRSS